jgi:hypothetical protein
MQVIEVARLGELRGLRHAARERFPGDHGLDGLKRITTGLSGLEERVPDPIEQAHLLVDRLAGLLEVLFVMAPRAIEQRADDAVVEINGLIDHGRSGFKDDRHQCGVPTRGLQFPHVLGGHLSTLAGELQEAVLMDVVFERGRQAEASMTRSRSRCSSTCLALGAPGDWRSQTSVLTVVPSRRFNSASSRS